LPLAAGSVFFVGGKIPTAVMADLVAGWNATAGDNNMRSTASSKKESFCVSWLFSTL